MEPSGNSDKKVEDTKKVSFFKILCKYIGGAIVLIVICFSAGFAKYIGKSNAKLVADNYDKGKTEGLIEKKLLDMQQKVRGQLPMMVDINTRLDAVVCSGMKAFYKYTMVNISESDIDKAAFEKEFSAHLIKNQCKNNNMIFLLKKGVEYHYIYNDKDGNCIVTIIINKNNCGL